ncbi:MAG: hypothetical protein N3B12_05390 [Armatimonadetes bacterium]|nr:hypothetical protein [Armatimonadota bacterium]
MEAHGRMFLAESGSRITLIASEAQPGEFGESYIDGTPVLGEDVCG